MQTTQTPNLTKPVTSLTNQMRCQGTGRYLSGDFQKPTAISLMRGASKPKGIRSLPNYMLNSPQDTSDGCSKVTSTIINEDIMSSWPNLEKEHVARGFHPLSLEACENLDEAIKNDEPLKPSVIREHNDFMDGMRQLFLGPKRR